MTWIPKTTETPSGKCDWEVTQSEYVEYATSIGSTLPAKMLIAGARGAHRWCVRLALQQGKPVPDEVLSDYPEIVREFS